MNCVSRLSGTALLAATFCLSSVGMAAHHEQGHQSKTDEGWIVMFDGNSLEDWHVSEENSDAFVIEDGAIKTVGGRAHLFYHPEGEAAPEFDDFELKMDVMVTTGSNSGIYFHTEYQPEGWPAKGYEAQLNNTHGDWRKTGGLYAIADIDETPVSDGDWFTYHIIVKDKTIKVKINGEKTVDFTEPTPPSPPEGMEGRVLSSGTIALQAHDPDSVTYFKNIRIKPLDKE